MKFVYQYRTSDNVRHQGVVSAASREEAFAALKRQGVKPMTVEDAPGVLNKLWGRGKRWIVIGVLGVLVLAVSVKLLSSLFEIKTQASEIESLSEQLSTFDSPMRRQLIGDTAVIEMGVRTGWTSVFQSEGDQFLASFAIPGVPAAKRNVAEKLLSDALTNAVEVVRTDGIEARQIKAIVKGMKAEILGLLANGWTLREVGSSLARRQEQEIQYYTRAAAEIEKATREGRPDVLQLWELRNAQLRRIGVKLIDFPEAK